VQCVMLGTGGFHPNETRHTAGVMLPECGVVLDAGTSAFRIAQHLKSPDLQIFLSHPHWDHIVGLPFLLVPMIDGRIQRCRVYGDAHTLEAVKTHLFAEATFPILPPFEFIPIDGIAEIPVRGGMLRHQTLPSHPGGSRAYRIDLDNTSLAYVTDTSTDGTYADFIRGSGTLIHECYFADGRESLAEKTGHSCLSPVARVAADAGVRQLYLSHIDPLFPDASSLNLSVARRIFEQTEIARDGLTFDLQPTTGPRG
jgi:ribonuclease Z